MKRSELRQIIKEEMLSEIYSDELKTVEKVMLTLIKLEKKLKYRKEADTLNIAFDNLSRLRNMLKDDIVQNSFKNPKQS